ncbi:DNA recombination/repair protein RecA [archaeon]|nr:DNA recombination/repair protein RecA [archaeon]|tara:strand:+ start:7880 stop:9028 length:1149 start_codon:yes stop_codon:yes gene_type:complete
MSKDTPEDFTSDLIKALNKDHGSRVAYNLSIDDSPTHVNRWISTGSRLLDYTCSNRRDGGLPEGRIIEIFGPPSIGKSHIATQIARSTQSMGGIIVYIDTENATSVENLRMLGVDVSNRFVYVDTHCTEEVFQVAEATILKAKGMNKDVPITIVWDSVAASSPKAELLGDYDKESIGLQARAISKGMRKITGVIGDQNILFVILNQTRTKIGVMFGDPTTTPGGKAIPFHASTRIKLGAGQQIKDGDDVIGIHVSAKTIKNKVAPPFRTVNFEIHFGVGIREHEQIFDILRKNGPEIVGKNIVEISGTGGWKYLQVADKNTGEVIIEKKFRKNEFDKIIDSEEYSVYIDDLLEVVMVKKFNTDPDIDLESLVEVEAIALEIE